VLSFFAIAYIHIGHVGLPSEAKVLCEEKFRHISPEQSPSVYRCPVDFQDGTPFRRTGEPVKLNGLPHRPRRLGRSPAGMEERFTIHVTGDVVG
jgi:hypothetical protein